MFVETLMKSGRRTTGMVGSDRARRHRSLLQINNIFTSPTTIINTISMFWTIGCLYGASSVAIGAFGAHGLKNRIADPSKLANWSTAAQYQVNKSEHLDV